MGELNFCLLNDIIKLSIDQTISDQSLDLGLPYLFVRFFHNKIFALLSFSLRCYFLYFDLFQLVTFVHVLMLPFVAYAFLAKGARKFIFIVQIFMPLFFIFNPLKLDLKARIDLFVIYYTTLGIIGMLKFSFNLQKRFAKKNGSKN